MRTIVEYKKMFEQAFPDAFFDIKRYHDEGALAKPTGGKVYLIYDHDDLTKYVEGILHSADDAELRISQHMDVWTAVAEDVHALDKFRKIVKKLATPQQYKDILYARTKAKKHAKSSRRKIIYYEWCADFWNIVNEKCIIGICVMAALETWNAEEMKREFGELLLEMNSLTPFEKGYQETVISDVEEYGVVFQVDEDYWNE